MKPFRLQWDPENEPGDDAMRFRLFYEGPLRSSQGEVRDGQVDRKRDHKQSIRQAFSGQLWHLWRSHPSLRAAESDGSVFGLSFGERLPLVQAIARNQPEVAGKRFIPLVCEEFDLICRIDILMLRRDKPGGVFQLRDIDNRLKTVLDALRAPHSVGEVGENLVDYPYDNMCVLLQDDKLSTHVSVETNELLGVEDAADDYVRLMITVSLAPYRATVFNFGLF